MTLLSVKDLQITFGIDEGDITAVDKVSFDLSRAKSWGSSMVLAAGNDRVDILSLKRPKELRKIRGDLISTISRRCRPRFQAASRARWNGRKAASSTQDAPMQRSVNVTRRYPSISILRMAILPHVFSMKRTREGRPDGHANPRSLDQRPDRPISAGEIALPRTAHAHSGGGA